METECAAEGRRRSTLASMRDVTGVALCGHDGSTRGDGPLLRRPLRVALIGEGIATSLTPRLHMAEAGEHGIPYAYEIIDLAGRERQADDLAGLLAGLRDDGYRGVNVTHPHKQRVLALLDRLSPAAAHIGAVNHVSFEADGSMVGHNTDWTGFRSALVAELGGLPRATVLQLGAGGAGAATAYALLDLGVDRLLVADVDPARAAALVGAYLPLFPDREVVTVASDAVTDQLRGIDGLVHATPIGMAAHPGIAVDLAPLRAAAWVAEIVYRPLETELVQAARAAGHPVLAGGRMAVGQACDSLALFADIAPDRARMYRALLALLEAEAQLDG